MATYTVNITGSLSSSYGYVTINGTKITTTGTKTYTSKPTISVYVSSSNTTASSRCTVTLNGETVKSGYGTYNLTTDATTIDIAFSTASYSIYTYYNTAINAVVTDPMDPHDGHNTNIGSVAYEIEGGTVRIGGVAREVDDGLVLAGGVSREIPFGGPPVIVTISGKASSSYAYATINGTKLSSTGSWEYEAPLTIQVYVGAKGGSSANMYIKLNGEKVATGTPSRHTFETSASTVTINFTTETNGSATYYSATITTS